MKKGGEPFDASKYAAGQTRADMVALISQYCLEHSSKIADALLAAFDIHRRSIKERTA